MVRPKKHRILKRKTYGNKDDHMLILHNDDVNTFDFVIEMLVTICKHSYEQAEQCAIITHYKGKCDIKHGHYLFLQSFQKKMLLKGFHVTIE